MSGNYDAIIIGAGIVGTACALECAQAGMRVAVVEGDVIGGGATAAGMGHIVVMDDSPAQLALTKYSQQLWRELAPQLPADAEYETIGTIWVAANPDEMNEVFRKQAVYRQHGIAAEALDSKSLREAEPNLHPGLAGGLLVPSDAVLYPPCSARYLLEQAMRLGTVVLSKIAVKIGSGCVECSDGSKLASPIIVNAAGAASPELTPGLPVRKRKGHLVITDRYPGFVRHQLVELGYIKSAGSSTADSVAFNVQPRKTGQMLIGSSRQYDAEQKEVDHAILRRMMQRAQQYLQGLEDLSMVRAWTGFRASTPDKLPLIGPHLEDTTIFLATGHEGLGITTALATARLLVDQCLGRDSEIPSEPYLPARMALESHHA